MNRDAGFAFASDTKIPCSRVQRPAPTTQIPAGSDNACSASRVSLSLSDSCGHGQDYQTHHSPFCSPLTFTYHSVIFRATTEAELLRLIAVLA